jgi:putative endonuclease
MKSYCVYILAGNSAVLYTGITSGLETRIVQHKRKILAGFTKRYNVGRLVFYEVYGDVRAAITREKEIKAWRREKKVALIQSFNPRWEDLADERGRIRAPSPRQNE